MFGGCNPKNNNKTNIQNQETGNVGISSEHFQNWNILRDHEPNVASPHSQSISPDSQSAALIVIGPRGVVHLNQIQGETPFPSRLRVVEFTQFYGDNPHHWGKVWSNGI